MPDLFDALIDPSMNCLPKDGVVNYYGPVIPPEEAGHYCRCLLEHIEWKHDEAVIFGKHIVTQRKVAWYADHPFVEDQPTSITMDHNVIGIEGAY